ncbi:MAG: cyclic beta 1-2 glucan synthetase, partial [Methanomicrobiales archaeon HGW-Methanomicrobiales-4]
MDWREFVERLSLIEHILRSDPADEYAAMEFETRDQYRHAIEEIAKKNDYSEADVAQKAVDLAALNRSSNNRNPRTSHVGYYLIDEGRENLLSALSFHPSLIKRIHRTALTHLFPLYICGILIITLIVTFFGFIRLITNGWFVTLPILILLLFPVSQGAIAVINWFITLLLNPVPLPKMDYSIGIPVNQKTIVVIPTVISGSADVSRLVDSLETRYLGNREENLYFALLTDLRNADAQELPGDEEVVDQLATGIEALNERYQSGKPGVFFLMHRSRTWNEGERIWMGYERKRGILEAFSTLISASGNNPFSRIVGNLELLTNIRYVITLDTDTQLPRNSARRLIGAISHPLNRPVSDPETPVIRKGYGILQPRVSLSLSESGFSRFTSIFGGEQGIDPYTQAVSDVYQDAFQEGSFIGKGIYDLEVFSHSVKGKFPENLILSHDLLEGCFARTGLVSDVQIFEEYPVSYLADIKRRHRWIRGDWQIAAWLLPSIPEYSSKKQKNPLSLLSQWKIFDNLRRSLVSPVVLLLLIISWILFQDPLFWTAYITSLYLVPPMIIAGWKGIRKPAEQTWKLHLQEIPTLISSQVAVPLMTLIFLPYEAYNSLDAILRSCWRMTVSHRNLLAWTTHQEVGQTKNPDIPGSYRVMWPGPVIGVALFMGMFLNLPSPSLGTALFACAWILSPAIAWGISQPIRMRTTSLTDGQVIFLRSLARRTWRFFETYVTAEDHHLPPDNYQEQPVVAVAHRTSPTDIGLSLLANLTAYDFGYIPVRNLIERTENTLTTMGKMKRFRGHFYNWYDTITLEPLLPRYIST